MRVSASKYAQKALPFKTEYVAASPPTPGAFHHYTKQPVRSRFPLILLPSILAETGENLSILSFDGPVTGLHGGSFHPTLRFRDLWNRTAITALTEKKWRELWPAFVASEIFCDYFLRIFLKSGHNIKIMSER